MMVDCTVNPHTGREMQFDYYLSGNTARAGRLWPEARRPECRPHCP
jgi:hypothetical protein